MEDAKMVRTINETEVLKKEVFNTENKSIEHTEHDIVDNLYLYKTLMTHFAFCSEVPLTMLHYITGILAILSCIAGVILKTMDVPECNVLYIIAAVLIILSISIWIAEKIMFRMNLEMSNYIMKDIAMSGLKEYAKYNDMCPMDRSRLIMRMMDCIQKIRSKDITKEEK